ncbi:hypothetical protein MEX01_19520 [Methylorubrum extorquens]|uniref:hypothetical protein n=1 Tax=Methylorubrum extorquens TaxID=408 RepID=UPI00116CFC9E|nr:hypothetical protein [Methylorubrum extorquens]GEL41361.1 hypothetical protein MEX01_19520 [Methylorubrum extorquens]
MARWNMRAQVIDLGVIEMGSDFVVYNGVKVAMPNGERRFLGKVMMHNEVHSVFNETQGEFVSLYLSGCKDREPALLYAMKTESEDVFRGDSPYRATKLQIGFTALLCLPFCLLLIGFPFLALCLVALLQLRRWNPPSQKVFEAQTARGTSSPGAGRVIAHEQPGPAT